MDGISWEGGEANPVQSSVLRCQPHKNDINKEEAGRRRKEPFSEKKLESQILTSIEQLREGNNRLS